jgi:spermidine synthase
MLLRKDWTDGIDGIDGIDKEVDMNTVVVKANIVVFIASFCTLVIELVAGRIMAPYVGVSLYTWTSIIGVVLAGISIGAWVGGILADRYPRPATLGWLLFLSGVGALTIAPLTDLIGAAQFQATLMLRILLLTTAIFFIPSTLLGMISPVVVKLTLDNLNRTGNIVGKIYAFSTLGSIIGTFATGFFLISWMGTRNILLTMGAILIVSAFLFGGLFLKRKAAVISAVLIAGVSVLVFTMFGYAYKPILDEKTYYYKESDYFTIKLKKYPIKNGTVEGEALILDNLIHSINDVNDPTFLDYDYIRIYEEVLSWQMKQRSSIDALFIGGGGYTFPRYIETKYTGAQIDVVEIDPEVTRVVCEYLGLPRSTTIRSFNEDGRWFVMNSKDKGRYDFIFGDAFNDLSIPYHLTTKEFAQQMKELLKPDGLLIANLIDSVTEGLFLPSYIRTLEEVFGKGNVNLLVLAPELRRLGIATCVVVASPTKMDMEDFARVIGARPGMKMTANTIPQERLQEILRDRSAVILTDDYVPVDNLTAPIFEARYGYKKK